MKVREAMAKTFSTASSSDSIETVARLMVKEDCGFIPIVDAGRLVGVITDRDIVVKCVSQGQHDVLSMTAGSVMSKDAKTIGPEDTLEEAAHRMARYQVRRLPVVENGRLVGILSHGNLVQALHGQGAAIEATVGVTVGA
ncbi:MAG TPA: CBS domain-containing protein [Candidatus Dormibacteraeota bacterium]|jgi:CBS domain-containing protein|nr:CBS domain-containing protein [Candidatus Dormibacteraeota bacterium]